MSHGRDLTLPKARSLLERVDLCMQAASISIDENRCVLREDHRREEAHPPVSSKGRRDGNQVLAHAVARDRCESHRQLPSRAPAHERGGRQRTQRYRDKARLWISGEAADRDEHGNQKTYVQQRPEFPVALERSGPDQAEEQKRDAQQKPVKAAARRFAPAQMLIVREIREYDQ